MRRVLPQSGMLENTKLNSKTQKIEASNRIMRRSLPKDNTFIRNFPGRAHSAAHIINHGPGESIFTLCKLEGSTISRGTRIARTLNGYQNIFQIQKKSVKGRNCIRTPDVVSEELFLLYAENNKKRLNL